MAELGGVLAIVAADSDDFRRAHGEGEFGFGEGDVIDALGAEIFHVSTDLFGRGDEQAGDFFAAGDGFYESVVDVSVGVEAAIFHEGY